MTNESEQQVMSALLSWGRRRKALERERDPLVLRALATGLPKEAIHQFTGLGRSTIDRIQAGPEAPF